MAAGKALLLLLSFAFTGVFGDNTNDRRLDYIFDSGDREDSGHPELCWERCFQVEDTDYERFREIYDDFYRIGMQLRKLKNLYGVNGTALLLDSTLASYLDDTSLSMEDQASEIWQFQLNIAGIIAMLTGADNDHNPFYIYQFNEKDG